MVHVLWAIVAFGTPLSYKYLWIVYSGDISTSSPASEYNNNSEYANLEDLKIYRVLDVMKQ